MAEPRQSDPPLVLETARQIALGLAQRRGIDAVRLLAERSPHIRYCDFPGALTEERLAEMLYDLRTLGIDTGAAFRTAENRIASDGVDVDIPISPPGSS